MVSASIKNNNECRFEIRPNRSLSWRGAKLFYAGMVAISLTIALGFASLGYWPVLPFAGAELLVLGCALYLCALDGKRREIVLVDDATVEVEKGRTTLERSASFARAWTRVRVARPSVAWYPSRLLLGSHGREVEVGQFLNEEEREKLAVDLHRMIVAGRGG